MVESGDLVGREGRVDVREERGVRYLHLGSEWVQGAMRIARPWALELEYTRELMFPLLLRPATWPASVLQVGLGAASVTRFLYRHRPRARLFVAEIEPRVVSAARAFFKLPEDRSRLRIEVADGHDYLASHERCYDLIIVDGYDEGGRTGMLETLPFYANCRARLEPGGLVAANLVDRRRGGVVASAGRLAQAFDDRVLVLPRGLDGNTIALAGVESRRGVKLDSLYARAEKLRRATGLGLESTLARLARHIGADATLAL